MYEDIAKKIATKANNPGFDSNLYTQNLLDDFAGALEAATKDGIKYDEIMNVGKWELKFSPPREDGLLPVIMHAVFKGWGN